MGLEVSVYFAYTHRWVSANAQKCVGTEWRCADGVSAVITAATAIVIVIILTEKVLGQRAHTASIVTISTATPIERIVPIGARTIVTITTITAVHSQVASSESAQGFQAHYINIGRSSNLFAVWIVPALATSITAYI